MPASPSPLRRLIVVTGPPRCGTTMLAALLSRPPAYPYLPECAVLTDFIRERLRSERDQHPLKFSAFLGDARGADRVYRDTIRRVLRRIAKASGQMHPVMVLKDPFLLEFLDVLARLMPLPTRVVCIIRDPRDAVNSMLEVRRRAGVPERVGEAVDFLRPFYDRVLAVQRSDLARMTALIVRYEDVVLKDTAALNALQRHVGYSLSLDDYRGVPREKMDLQSCWHTPLYEAAVTSARIANSRRSLTGQQLEEVQQAFSDVLSSFGYDGF